MDRMTIVDVVSRHAVDIKRVARVPVIVGFVGLMFFGMAFAQDPRGLARVEVGKLIETFLTNEAYADEHYTDKSIEVTGKVQHVRRTELPASQFKEEYLLELEGARTDASRVLLLFEATERRHLASIKPGQKVVVRGVCGRRTVHIELKGKAELNVVHLRQCTLVEGD